jgi:hypothetical protein
MTGGSLTWLSAGAEVDATECCTALVEKADPLEKAADAVENAPGQMARWRGRMVGVVLERGRERMAAGQARWRGP